MDTVQQAAALADLGPRRHEVKLGQHSHKLEVVELTGHRVRFICDAVMDSAAYVRDGARLRFSWRGVPREALDTTRAASAKQEGGATVDGKLRASMNGRVVAVLVQVGQRVTAGQPVVTLEAMKMEHIHAAPLAGTVTAVHAAAGDQVPTGRVIVEIETDPPSA